LRARALFEHRSFVPDFSYRMRNSSSSGFGGRPYLAGALFLATAAALAAIAQTQPWSLATLRSGKGFLELQTFVLASPAAFCETTVSIAVSQNPALGAQVPEDIAKLLPPGAAASLARGGPVSTGCEPLDADAVRALALFAAGGGSGSVGGGAASDGLDAGQPELLAGLLSAARGAVWAGSALALSAACFVALPAAAGACDCTGAGRRGACALAGAASLLLLLPLCAWAGLHARLFSAGAPGLVASLGAGFALLAAASCCAFVGLLLFEFAAGCGCAQHGARMVLPPPSAAAALAARNGALAALPPLPRALPAAAAQPSPLPPPARMPLAEDRQHAALHSFDSCSPPAAAAASAARPALGAARW